MKKVAVIISSVLLVLFTACSASTDTRYGKDEKEEKTVLPDKTDEKIVEDFDFSEYKEEFEIPEKEITGGNNSLPGDFIVWYDYDNVTDNPLQTKKVIDRVSGYRVLVLTTDNLEEANDMRSEIYFKVVLKEVYVIFDPPFYKVMVGDFIEITEARDMNFKLSQLGYSDARVVNETVNIFEQ